MRPAASTPPWCWQLFNHIAEGATYRRCENCDRIFVRQRDGAAQGQYRTEGVKYCSRKCAWAAGQRSWRKRKQARELHAQGTAVGQIAARLGVDVETLAEWIVETNQKDRLREIR